ncbi:hypothetical protein JRQ81_009267 [Phrynocephalus forsythii]|uniref:Uncharacterized protein n=1 Tax=Phrynocephalus forsythii TaxID=171643 RepID=A0A9Q0X9I5_9SAUR|nr:hypothetical protein JRQ81_009267 [Phrynocephalus forsythii]
MDERIPKSPPIVTYRYRPARHRMPYYGYYQEPLGPPLPPFVAKRLPKYSSQYIPLYESRYLPPRNISPPRKGQWVWLHSPPRMEGYRPQRAPVCPEPQGIKYPRRNLGRNPRQPYVDIYDQTRIKCPYNGMAKGAHVAINKCFPAPQVPRAAPLPRATKGPVLYSPKDLEPHIPREPLPRMTKGPILYSREDLEPYPVKTPLPRVSKGPVMYSTKVSQPLAAKGSQANVTKTPQSLGSKGTLPRATKGPRFLAKKVPRFRVPNFSRSFRRKSSRSNLMKDSQASLTKGSRPSLARGSRVSLAKGSQPSLVHSPTDPAPKKLSKNVKISSTGKKYCSASKWPF